MVSRKLNQIIIINIVATVFFTLIYLIFLLSTLWSVKLFNIALFITLPYLIFSILSYFQPRFFPILPFCLNILLTTLQIAGKDIIKLHAFLLVPIILAMYYGSKRLNKVVLGFNILCYFIAMLGHGILNALTMPKLFIIPIISTMPYTLEMFSVIWLSKRFIIDADQIKRQNEIYNSKAFKNSNLTIDIFKSIYYSKNKIQQIHAENVLLYTNVIVDELSKKEEYVGLLTDKYKQYIENGAFLHNIGIFNVDNSEIINKLDDFTENELKIVKKVPEIGVEIIDSLPEELFNIEEKEVVLNIIMQCHERMNNTGYPRNISRRQISLEAQIVAVAEYLDSSLLITSLNEKKKRNFNNIYMELITKGYDLFNQDVVNCVYERRAEILEFSKAQNDNMIQFLKNNK